MKMDTVKSKPIGSYIMLAIALILAFLIWNNHILAGTSPINLGIHNGKLAACLSTPNCVNSQAPANDVEHAISPIAFGGEASATMADLKLVLKNTPRSNIITEGNNYIYAEFTSKLMGFVDDAEFYLDDSNKTIQVRSASRLGESDLGVNRQRIEEIRTQIQGLN
jgi:uncharacterized protein (DUF1499 family)